MKNSTCNISTEAPGTIATKFYVKPSGNEGIHFCSNGPGHIGHITNMATMAVDSKTL